ncbi:MAG: hypothetical protein K8R67_09105 [Desulfobacteraceae bacterium]|nr:hypothetical protein [Desulfobacteraceae bacterium]
MTKQQKEAYQDVEVLKKIIQKLKGKKFRLDCGHHITFGYYLGSDITIRNGKEPEITCSLCGY